MFQTALELRADAVPDVWVVTAPLVWRDTTYGQLIAPAGFRTDLASTPFHVDDTGSSRRPAVIHDALYTLGRRLGKDFADAFLRDAILAEGGGRMRAQTYYWAVRWFGGAAWKGDGRQVGTADFDTAAAFNAWMLSDKTLGNLGARTVG